MDGADDGGGGEPNFCRIRESLTAAESRMPNRRKRRSRGRGEAQKSGRAGRDGIEILVAQIREKGAEAGVPAFSTWHAGTPIGKSNPSKGTRLPRPFFLDPAQPKASEWVSQER